MEALVLEGKRNIVLREIETPKANGHDVIIKVEKCGICGGDFHFLYDSGDSLKGLVMGHEFSGTVVDPGANTELSVGDRVTASPENSCGTCSLCKMGNQNACAKNFSAGFGLSVGYRGAYAEYAAVRPDMVMKIPESLSFTEAALVEPAAVGLHAVNRGKVGVGDKVLIIGAGIIGLACATFARLAGASYVALLETNMSKANNALNFGDVDKIFDAKEEDSIQKAIDSNGGVGFDKVFECSGAEAGMVSALRVTKPKGTIIVVGAAAQNISIPLYLSIFGEFDIKPTYAYTAAEFKTAMNFISSGAVDVKKYATKEVKMVDVPKVFDDLVNGRLENPKVIIDVANSGN
ncbi:zinc-binding dehydrogenase [Bacillus sp. MRMR6]|uniref:zinc-dependent alcohol dehydrogenase n=1 Tax=Bacillus sp. MRMR6 TaxID=1928617 RepID=UPI0009513E0D|nr:alcohol dehydrogenase catalytic domain-containing protein [Bacillus sp. MRMR6]OLS33773.1 hypothetical protein BTR25_24060 [Bacillus sp. MRMR6]